MSGKCVVCNKESDNLVSRRTGLKCKGCVGKPATLTNQRKFQEEHGFIAIFNGKVSHNNPPPKDGYQPLKETTPPDYGTNS